MNIFESYNDLLCYCVILLNDEENTNILEGNTFLKVPISSIASKTPPKRPVFYNPKAQLNRDISILIYKEITHDLSKSIVMSDALSGLGARGIRVAVEVPKIKKVFLNDWNPIAIKYAKDSAEINNVTERCSFSTNDVCKFLIEHSTPLERFDIIDMDPFGSPAPYLDCAIRAIKNNGLISVTATDSPVLCGVYPSVALRKYYGRSLRTEYCHEIGIRLLISALAHSAMKLDKGIIPLFSHNTRLYSRIYALVLSGSSHADRNVKNLGFILHCFKCGNRKTGSFHEMVCNECNGNFKIAGPLWTSQIHNDVFLSKLSSRLNNSKKEIYKLINLAKDESDMPPTYFVPDKLADSLQLKTPSLISVINNLIKKGFRATRSSINLKGIKTDASVSTITEVMKQLSI
jgi:tRNA (guanine26-N2/guanine27-N2)-dimethyltransferase